MRTVLTLVLLAACGLSQAQTIWRCGADGRSYSDSPCQDGQMVALAADARSPADMAEARAVAARDQRLARQMVLERREREREALSRGNGLAAIKPAAVLTPKEPVQRSARRPSAKRPGAAARSARTAAPSIQRTPD